jgi:hypothetical protein
MVRGRQTATKGGPKVAEGLNSVDNVKRDLAMPLPGIGIFNPEREMGPVAPEAPALQKDTVSLFLTIHYQDNYAQPSNCQTTGMVPRR